MEVENAILHNPNPNPTTITNSLCPGRRKEEAQREEEKPVVIDHVDVDGAVVGESDQIDAKNNFDLMHHHQAEPEQDKSATNANTITINTNTNTNTNAITSVSDSEIFHILPQDVVFYEIFPLLSFSDLAAAFRTCKKWSEVCYLDHFWQNYVNKRFTPTPLPCSLPFYQHKPIFYKPEGKNWKWVAQSKRKIPQDKKFGFTGVGSMEKPSFNELLYEGDWVDGEKHGYGVSIEIWNKEVYMGQFERNLKNGRGKYFWSFGDFYEGEYVLNRRTGVGFYRWINGDTYEGEFLDHKKHGHGHYKWILGDEYVGSYVHDAQTGDGTYSWSNGNMYIGGHSDDTRNGLGKFVEKGGHTIEGQWKDGLPLSDKGIFEISHTLSKINPRVKKAIEDGVCTYTVTGRERLGQLFYMIGKTDDRPHGVCLVCVKKCVPKNLVHGMQLTDEKIIFGGNFFCDCGAETNPRFICYAQKKEKEEEAE